MTVEEIINNHKEIYANPFAFEPDFRIWSEIGALSACPDSPLSSIISSTVDKVIQKEMLTVGKIITGKYAVHSDCPA